MIEVILFLAVSSIMLTAFMVTISGRIGNQRYNDATNSFVDFLRSVYSKAINVQNFRQDKISSQDQYYCTLTGQMAYNHDVYDTNTDTPTKMDESYPGRSSCAIYGKLISFGERNQETIYVYDIIGKAIDFNNPIFEDGTRPSTIAGELAAVHADVFSFNADGNENGKFSLNTAANYETYLPEWGTTIESPTKDNKLFHGAVLIVRAPSSGGIKTYFLNKTLPIQELIDDTQLNNKNASDVGNVAVEVNSKGALITPYLEQTEQGNTNPDEAFVMKEVDFCIATGDLFAGVSVRNDIRLREDGHNSTAVEFVEKDEGGNNRCR